MTKLGGKWAVRRYPDRHRERETETETGRQLHSLTLSTSTHEYTHSHSHTHIHIHTLCSGSPTTFCHNEAKTHFGFCFQFVVHFFHTFSTCCALYCRLLFRLDSLCLFFLCAVLCLSLSLSFSDFAFMFALSAFASQQIDSDNW